MGTKFTIKHLNNKLINIETEGPIYNDDVFICPNMGMNNQRSVGNLVVKYKVLKEINLTKENIKLVKKIFKYDNFPYNPRVKKVDLMTPEEFASIMKKIVIQEFNVLNNK